MTVAKAVDENYKATEEVVVFNNDEVVHVSVEAKNYTSADVFETKWFLDGKEYDSVKYSFERSGETGYIDFTLAPTEGSRSPVGEYEVKIYLNGEYAAAAKFEIIGPIVGPQYSSEQLGFKINYPEGWDAQEDLSQNIVGFSKLSEPIALLMVVRTDSPRASAKELTLTFLDELKKDPNYGQAVGKVTSGGDITLGGEPAYEIHFAMIQGKSEWGDDGIVIGAYHKSNAYFVVILGQEGYMVPQIMDLVSGSV